MKLFSHPSVPSRPVLALVALLAGLSLVPAASARLSAPVEQSARPAAVWAIALPDSTRAAAPAQLAWLARHGVTTIVAGRGAAAALPQLSADAARAGLTVVAPQAQTPSRPCRPSRGALETCAVRASSPPDAIRLARRALVDYVVVRVATTSQLAALRGLPSGRTRVLAILPLTAGRATWAAAVAYAIPDPVLDVGVAAPPIASPRLAADLTVLTGADRVAGRDSQAPSVPQGMAFSRRSQTTVSVAWRASTDNVAVAGYRLYRNGRAVDATATPGYTFRGLRCGTTYTFALASFDAAGNYSNRAEATGTGTTDACGAQVGAAPGTANLWVDPSGGSCVRRSVAGPYADAAGCTWNRAYQTAQTGDLILVRGGEYGNVLIGPTKASIAAPGVTFRPAEGESVSVADFENGRVSSSNGADNITFRGPVRARTFRSDGGSNIVVDGWRVDCGGCDNVQAFHVEDATNVAIRNSDISNNRNNSLVWISGTRISFVNNRIHDAGLTADSGAHTECMYAWNVTGLTLTRNHFFHCSVMDVFITGSELAEGGLVENNVFERPWETTGVVSRSGYSFHFRTGGSPSPSPSNWDFRYNTFVGPLSISRDENEVGAGGMRVIGNVFLASSACGQPNTTYAYNAFVSGACGTKAITRSLSTYLAGFVDPADPGNYALRPTSVLRNRGNRDDFPRVDRAGRARFSESAPDLGAYEFPQPGK